MVLGVIAEHSLPLSVSPVLLNLAKELARDPRALEETSMDRTSASYKLNHGLKKTFLDGILQEIRNQPFSLNIDEATSKTNVRVLAVLVSYWSLAHERIVVEHLSAIELNTVTAQSLFKSLDGLFNQHEIPWRNLISILMDSCAVMRGSKNGLETIIREQRAPHMLDIDGDSCHHIHNASKKLSAHFEGWVEGLLTDLHTDHKWSVDMRDKLFEICSLIGVAHSRPERFVSHRWLSCYDVSLDTLRMWDAYVIFYFAFLPKENKNDYRDVITSVLIKHDVPQPARLQLKEVWKALEVKSKNFTDDGRRRKARICQKVLYQEKKTLLELNFYVAVMPLLKAYIMLFQCKEPLIHKLHDMQQQTFHEFLTCFVKPESLIDAKGENLSGHKMKMLDLFDNDTLLSKPFIGNKCSAILQELKSGDTLALSFREKVKQGYSECGTYLQGKLPLSSKTLRSLSCLDPDARGSHQILQQLLHMPKMLPTGYFTTVDTDDYSFECHKFCSDMSLPNCLEHPRVDDWWNAVRKTNKYSSLSKLALALLSPFHGPQVESSFNVMGDILHSKSANTSVETYSSYQVVKYHLRTAQKSAVQYFTREQPKFSPVSASLCRNIKLASSRYRKIQKQKHEQQAEIRRKLQLKKSNIVLKQAGKDKIEEKTNKSRKEFQQLRQKRLSALKKLAAAKHAKIAKK